MCCLQQRRAGQRKVCRSPALRSRGLPQPTADTQAGVLMSFLVLLRPDLLHGACLTRPPTCVSTPPARTQFALVTYQLGE